MTLEEAREHIGSIVVYRSYAKDPKPQDGTIVGVNDTFVRVRYGHNDSSIQSTPPEMLELLCPKV